MLTRRAFLIGSGAAALAVGLGADVTRYFGKTAVPTGAVALTSQPYGGWTWIQEPRAVGYGGYTYFGYVVEGSKIAMRVVADGSSTPSAEIVLDSGNPTTDEHNAPTFLVRDSDHKLLVFYQVGSHETYQRISTTSLDTDPTLANGLGAASSLQTLGLAAPVSNRNFPNPIQLTGEAGSPIYLFYRDNAVSPANSGTWRYAKSTDGGASWVYQAALIQSSTAANWSYLVTVPNGTSRIDFQFVNGFPGTSTVTGEKANIYHFYMTGGAFFKSDGTAAGSPLLHESNVTLVYDGSTNGAWLGSIAIDGSGNPVMAFPVYVSSTDHRYRYASWSGSAWSDHQIAAAGTHMATLVGPGGLQLYYPAGVVLDTADPQIVYCSIQSAADVWELWSYVTANAGVSFTPTAITSGSTAKNIRPVSPRFQGTRALLWTYGTWSDYTVYAQQVMSV